MEKKYYIIGGVLVLVLILAAVLFISSNSGHKTSSSNGKIVLVWWKPFEDSENIQGLISDYEATHKNVTINYVKKDDTTYEQDLVNAIAAGNGPDIFSIHNDWLPKQIDKITPMPDTEMNLRTYEDTFLDVAATDFVQSGKIYAIPLSIDLLGLYYNKDILNSAGISQPPATWPEFVSDVETITKISKPGEFDMSGAALGTSSNVNRAVDIISLLMLQNGTKFYSDDLNTATFDQQQTVAGSQPFSPGATALDFYTQFAQPSKVAYTWNSNSDDSIDAFTEGKVAMMLNYSYTEPVIRAKAPNLNWGVADVPQISDQANKVNFANYWAETVSKSSANSAAAWDFLNFISSKAELTKYYVLHNQVSSRKDMIPGQVADLDIGSFAENALTATSVYKKDADLFEAVFLKMIDDVILRNSTSDDALHNAAQQINLNLQQQ